MASITNLADYAKRIDAQSKPTDRFNVSLTRSMRDVLIKELTDRKKKLSQAVGDSGTKESKRAKRQAALYETTELLTALELSLTDKGIIEEAVLNLQRVVLDACTALDLICEKGGER